MKKLRISPLSFITYPALYVLCGVRVFSLFIAAAALHEAGHFIAIRHAGLRVLRVSVTPTGLDIARSGGCSYLREAWISFAGPAAGLCTALISNFAGALDFCAVNLICSALNLIPVIPLDGGCALRALLLHFLDFNKAEGVVRAISVFTLFCVYVLSCILFIYTEWNATLLLLCAVIFVRIFLSEKN